MSQQEKACYIQTAREPLIMSTIGAKQETLTFIRVARGYGCMSPVLVGKFVH